MRHLNSEGVAFIKSFEALRLQSYDDATGRTLAAGAAPRGTATIGWGHTSGVTPGQVCTEEEAEIWLDGDLGPAAAAVEQAVRVPLGDNEFTALVSFVFNVGVAAFMGSTLLKRLNAGDYDGVPKQLARWNKAGGKICAGLTRRRAAEATLWSTPAAAAPAARAVDRPTHLARLVTLGGITVGAASTALSDCAQQLQPLAGYGGAAKGLFLAVAIAAAGAALIARLHTLKKEGV